MLNECTGKSNLYVQVDFVVENTKKNNFICAYSNNKASGKFLIDD